MRVFYLPEKAEYLAVYLNVRITGMHFRIPKPRFNGGVPRNTHGKLRLQD